jgi:hypothetical protein
MKDIEREQYLIRKYLLGELNEYEREQLEQRVITNPDYKEEVLITEEELLEEFVNGTLSAPEFESFTRMYSSSPGQRRKINIAQALNKYASEHSTVVQPTPSHKRWAKSLIELFRTKNRFHQLSLAVVTMLAVGGAILVYWLISHERKANYEALLKLNQPGSVILQPDSSVVSVSLPPLLFRGTGEPRNVTITNQTETVQLLLPDPSGGTRLIRAILKDSNAAEVLRLEDLRARQIDQNLMLVLQIPARMLTPQNYQLEISEKKPDGNYEIPATYPIHLETRKSSF